MDAVKAVNNKSWVRFPNESFFEEVQLDLSRFKPEKEFDDEIFGWYDDSIYISIKKQGLKKNLAYLLLVLTSCYNLEYAGAGRTKYESDEAYQQPGEPFGGPVKRPESSEDFFNTAKPVVPYEHRNFYDFNSYNRPFVYQPYQPVIVTPTPTYPIIKPDVIKPDYARGGRGTKPKPITHLKRP